MKAGRESYPHNLRGWVATGMSPGPPILLLASPGRLAVGLKVADKAERSLLISLGHSLCHQSLSVGDVCVAAQGRCLTPRALEMFLGEALFARCLWKPSSRHSREQPLAEARSRREEARRCFQNLQELYASLAARFCDASESTQPLLFHF